MAAKKYLNNNDKKVQRAQKMNKAIFRILLISVILLINFNFYLFFVKRQQISRSTTLVATNSDNLVASSLRNVNNSQVSADSPVKQSVTQKQAQNGYLTAEEYKSIIAHVPRDTQLMMTFLGLVFEKANDSQAGIQAFRDLLEYANSTQVQQRFAYLLPTEKPQQNVNPGHQTAENVLKKGQPDTQKAPPPTIPPLRNLKPPLSFQPIKTDYGASTFNMYHAFEPKHFSGLTPSIPHIIHQTWDSYQIPGVFQPWIRSMVKQHPDWEYWFWTPKDVECLLKKRYPQKYLEIYRRYPAMIFKTDFLRYFLLYEFGGFYVDLDVEAFRPLDFWTYEHACVMTHENYEHTYLLHNRRVPNVMTTAMGCRPGHPYFRLLQENLEEYQRKFARDVLKATGPFYLDDIFKIYMSSNWTAVKVSDNAVQNGSNTGDNGVQYVSSSENDITVLHPRYWLPTYDYRITSRLKTICRTAQIKLPAHGKETCNILQRTQFRNRVGPEAFLDHHWTHVNTWRGTKKQIDLFDLFTVAPNAKRVSDILQCDDPPSGPV